MSARLFRVALLFFLIAGVVGAVLRMSFFNPIIGMNYKFMLHTHSHIVLLGWVTNALFAMLYYVFFESKKKTSKKWIWWYGILQLTVIGMMVTFPFYGYATYSIIASTSHIIISYVFCFFVLKELRNEDKIWKNYISWGIIYFMLSTLGPFSLGPMVVNGLAGSQWYFLAIYFYLHFLYNGFFVFVIFGILFWWLDSRNITYSAKSANRLFSLTHIACVPSYALSTLWIHPPWYIYVIGAIASMVMLLSITYLWKVLRSAYQEIRKDINSGIVLLLSVSLISYIIKIVLQACSSFPAIADMAYENRSFTIAYLHLVFIGFVTFFILGWIYANRIFVFKKYQWVGLILLLLGFVISEFLIITPATIGYITGYYQWLFGASSLIALSLVWFIFSRRGVNI